MSDAHSLADQSLHAILYADIVGYSRHMDRDEAGTIARVGQTLHLIRKLIGDYDGRVENTAGDSVLALFSSATQALRFAVVMQRELAQEQAWADGQDPITFRVGIALGEITRGDDGLFGHSINLAARIQSVAPPGGICVSDMVFSAVRNRVDYTLRSLGPTPLKNITDPIEIYALTDEAPQPARTEVLVPPAATPRPMQPDQTPDRTIAILPLENLTGDTVDLHICRGLVADIISSLSRFRNLMVTARRSAFMVAEQVHSTREIGQHLGVRYVLSGSFQRAGTQIRITVDLVEAETEKTIWSERFDGSMADIFDFQDTVTATITSRLAIQIERAEQRRLAAHHHPNLNAYGFILRGQELSVRPRRDDNFNARRLFEQARDLDPAYGRSYAAMSRTFNVEWRYHWTQDPEAALRHALELAQLAVDRDDLDARGYAEMGLAHLYLKQHDEALAAYERALDLNPNDADLLAEMGDCLVYLGQSKRSVTLLEQAIQLNPYHPDFYLWYLGDAFFDLGEYEKTIQTLLKMRDQSEGHRLMAASYALLGEQDSARYHAEALLKVHPNFSIDRWRNVPPYKNPEDLDVFVEGLRRAGLR